MPGFIFASVHLQSSLRYLAPSSCRQPTRLRFYLTSIGGLSRRITFSRSCSRPARFDSGRSRNARLKRRVYRSERLGTARNFLSPFALEKNVLLKFVAAWRHHWRSGYGRGKGFRKAILSDKNPDPQESGSRPLAASQAPDGCDGSMPDSVEETTGVSGEGTEMAGIV